jgi:hypothetical protein
VNPDADTMRAVWAEGFFRRVTQLVAEGLDRDSAEVQVGFEEPHLACAVEQLAHPTEEWPEIQRRWLGDL